MISSSVPSSKSAVSRLTGLRGSSSRGSFAWPGLSLCGRVLGSRHLRRDPKATATLAPPNPKELLRATMSPTGRSRGLGGDVEVDLGVLVVEVDRRRDRAVVDREDRGDRLECAGAAEQVAGHRLGAGDHDLVDVRAERRVQHQPLGDVALRRRGRVGVDVEDRLRADPGLRQRAEDRPRAAAAHRVGLGDVVGVGGDPGAEHLGVDPGPAGPRMLLGLEDQHAGALAEHEPVAGGVPRPGDRGRVSGVLRQRHHVGERRDVERVDRRLRAAGHDDVGAAEPDLVDGHRDRLVAGRAGRDRGVHRGPRADVQADVRRRARSASASARRAARPAGVPSPSAGRSCRAG